MLNKQLIITVVQVNNAVYLMNNASYCNYLLIEFILIECKYSKIIWNESIIMILNTNIFSAGFDKSFIALYSKSHYVVTFRNAIKSSKIKFNLL